MYIREYDALRQVYENHFGFMLNRLAEVVELPDIVYKNEVLEDRCWNEFMVAFEEMGLKFEEDRNDVR